MRRNNNPRGPRQNGGPMRNDNFQLQDLDLQLELLKRKREMIEHQQEILASERQISQQRSYNYNYDQSHPMYDQQPKFNNSMNYAQYYDDAPQPRFGGNLLGKRQHNDWKSNVPPKRFSAPQGSKKPFGHQSGQSGFSNDRSSVQSMQPWSQPPPIFNSKPPLPSARYNSTRQSKPFRNNFKGNKVSKPKLPPSASVANKMISYPLPKRNAIASEIPKQLGERKHKPAKPVPEMILTANEEPTKQMAGRLELALGNILKEMRTSEWHAAYAAHFEVPSQMRQLKQTIRDRLRSVMLNKHVGSVDNILAQYRKVYPKDTDEETLKASPKRVDSKKERDRSVVFFETAKPEQYFRNNMKRVIHLALKEMFDELISNNANLDDKAVNETFKELIDVANDVKDASTDDDKKMDVNSENTEGNEEAKNTGEEENTEIPSDKKDAEVEVIDADKPNNDDQTVTDDKPVDETTDNDKPSKEDEVENTSEGVEVENEIDNTNESVEVEKAEVKEEDASVSVGDSRRHLERLMKTLVRRHLALELPKHRQQIMYILDLKGMYRKAKETVMSKIEEKMAASCRWADEQDKSVDLNTSVETIASEPKTPNYRVLPYYAKVTGDPVLPIRKMMQPFLQQFKPKSVKKFKNTQILFVGFADKNRFEEFIGIKTVEIGSSIITIKASDKVAVFNANTSTNANAAKDDDVQIVEPITSIDDAVSGDLDVQITELLSSIRKDEENMPINGGEENTNAVVDKEDAIVEEVKNNDDTVTIVKDDDVQIVPHEADSEDLLLKEPEQTEPIVIEDNEKEEAVLEDGANSAAVDENGKDVEEEVKDKVDELKNEGKETGRATPTRASTRLNTGTPSTIRTRRASRLAQN